MSLGIRATRGVIPKLKVKVLVGGEVRSDLRCTSINWQAGTDGMTASIVAPRERWDAVPVEKGEEIEVQVDGVTRFRGIVLGLTNSLSNSGWMVTITASSRLAESRTAYVGDGNKALGPDFDYPREVEKIEGTPAVRRKKPTGWTAVGVLRDWFPLGDPVVPSWRGGGGLLNEEWRTLLKPGNLAALRAALPGADIKIKSAFLTEALEELTHACAPMACRERVGAEENLIDFYRPGDPKQAPVPLFVGTGSTDAEAVTIESIDCEDMVDTARTRVIAYGREARAMITLYNDHPTAPLVPMWEPLLEGNVLANPTLAEQGIRSRGGQLDAGDKAQSEEYKKVFRRFAIPDVVRRYQIESGNLAELDIQVFKFPLPLSEDAPPEEGGPPQPGSVGVDPEFWTVATDDAGIVTAVSVEDELPATPELVKFSNRLKEGFIELAKPALNLLSTTLDGEGKAIHTFVPARIGITLTIQGRRVAFDTGIVGAEGVAAGMVHVVTNKDFGHDFVTTEGDPLHDDLGGEHHFDDCWVFLAAGEALDGDPVESGEWTYVADRIDLADDRAKLARLAYAELAAGKGAVRYSASIPWFTAAVRPGDRVVMRGQSDAPPGPHVVRSVTWDLTDEHRTTISTENAVPLNITGG